MVAKHVPNPFLTAFLVERDGIDEAVFLRLVGKRDFLGYIPIVVFYRPSSVLLLDDTVVFIIEVSLDAGVYPFSFGEGLCDSGFFFARRRIGVGQQGGAGGITFEVVLLCEDRD